MNKPLRLQRFPSFKLQFHGNIISAFLFLSPVEIQNPVNHVIQCARSLHQPSKSRKELRGKFGLVAFFFFASSIVQQFLGSEIKYFWWRRCQCWV
ncbi:hypothetical protein AAHE18_13G178900 [Arachis hypogaea]